MYYQHSITILSDGKTVTARDNKTGTQANARCSPEDEFNLSTGASLAVERLFEKYSEIKVGDRVSFTGKIDPLCIFEYSADFVENLDVPNSLKIRYCYSVSNPPLNGVYVVRAIVNDRAYIQILSGSAGCFLVSTKILKKVSK